MKTLRNLLLLIFASLLLSCEEDETLCPECPSVYSNQIILNDLEVIGDTVKLSWSKLDTIQFAGYLIVRKDDKETVVDPGNSYSNGIIARIYDSNVTTYSDKDIPLLPYLEYQVIGIVTSNYSNSYIFSNPKTYERESINIFEFDLLQVIPDTDNNLFYFIEKDQGVITIFNYKDLLVEKSITTDATIGYCSIGNNGGRKELYVPRSDGWVFIYDAETLEKIDQIDIAHPASCVVNNNSKLYISTDAWTNRPLKVYDRISKQMIYEGGDFDDTRLRIIPNSNTEILEVTINIGPTDLDYYKFDANGNFITHKNDMYHGDYPLNAEIFRFFPDGGKFITSSEGAIYDVNMNYINRLPQGNLSFSDYAFNSGTTTIYCACSNAKSIIAYSNPNFNILNEYKTKGYPYKIFRKDNTLICISKIIKDTYYSTTDQFIVEIINL